MTKSRQNLLWHLLIYKEFLVPTVIENVATSNEHLVQYLHNATAWVVLVKNHRYQNTDIRNGCSHRNILDFYLSNYFFIPQGGIFKTSDTLLYILRPRKECKEIYISHSLGNKRRMRQLNTFSGQWISQAVPSLRSWFSS